MKTTYDLQFQSVTVAFVEIDHGNPRAEENIKMAVEFWIGWEEALERCGGDYTKRFLKNLARFIVHHGESPQGNEGWPEMDSEAETGIFINFIDAYRVDDEALDITAVT